MFTDGQRHQSIHNNPADFQMCTWSAEPAAQSQCVTSQREQPEHKSKKAKTLKTCAQTHILTTRLTLNNSLLLHAQDSPAHSPCRPVNNKNNIINNAVWRRSRLTKHSGQPFGFHIVSRFILLNYISTFVHCRWTHCLYVGFSRILIRLYGLTVFIFVFLQQHKLGPLTWRPTWTLFGNNPLGPWSELDVVTVDWWICVWFLWCPALEADPQATLVGECVSCSSWFECGPALHFWDTLMRYIRTRGRRIRSWFVCDYDGQAALCYDGPLLGRRATVTERLATPAWLYLQNPPLHSPAAHFKMLQTALLNTSNKSWDHYR